MLAQTAKNQISSYLSPQDSAAILPFPPPSSTSGSHLSPGTHLSLGSFSNAISGPASRNDNFNTIESNDPSQLTITRNHPTHKNTGTTQLTRTRDHLKDRDEDNSSGPATPAIEKPTDKQQNVPASPTETQRQTLEVDSESDDSETFKEIPDLNAEERPSNEERYKAILSNVPKVITTGELSVTGTGTGQVDTLADKNPSLNAQGVDLAALLDVPVVKSDKAILWDKIAEAVAANDKANADFFIRLYSQLNDNSIQPLKPDILRSRSSDAANPLMSSSSSKKTTDKTAIIFVRGSLPKHFDVGFTPYFDKNIRELRGPIPLTIFDKKWQEDAIQFQTTKRSKGDEKEGNYTGFKYPNEWTQTFAKWTANHRNFHVTFRDLYNYPDFAEWILEHKANVDRIIAEDGFLVGFRYDLIIRQNAFSYQVETDQGTSAVDISIFRKDVKREAWKITRNLDELNFTDNPYAKDGPKFNFDPKTGKPKISKKAEESSHQADIRENRGMSRGRGNFRQRGPDRFQQERRSSDYGSYRDESYGYDYGGGFNKRQRDFHQNEEYSHGKQEYLNQRGGYEQRGGYRNGSNRGGSSKVVGKNDAPKGKEKDNS
ncbi:hypothetical protein PGTUg99_010875 [Puccinia graminis f. sp. tritici]|uniref:Uncharacterized protein n=1 Tax=Puccinia graminis f. sp. tritici TaxID=56615 RepID=A0A5B0R8M5_PUCGR|nr:hypothetical protein PGTUg99_010875 [Puccinia graminis f. sp. tritici]